MSINGNNTRQVKSNKLFKVSERFSPTEVTEPFSLIPVYREDVMKRFFQTYIEKIEATKDSLKDRVDTSFISDPNKENKLLKLTRKELHQKNMIIYYIIPLVYLVYSYVYIQFNKQQKLRIMYRETKIKYEMYAFLFDRRNPVIKKVNVYFHETFKKEDKIQSDDDKKLLGPIIDNKKQIIDFLKFVEQQIIAENDYTAELKRVDDIIDHLKVIEKYFEDAKTTENEANRKKNTIRKLEISIPAKIIEYQRQSNQHKKNKLNLELKKIQRTLFNLKKDILSGGSLKIHKGGKIKTIENLISDKRNSKLQKKYRKTYDNILNEMQQANLLIIELDDLESINTLDYILLKNNLNNEEITKLKNSYNTIKTNLENKNKSQIQTKEQIKKTIELLNSDTELYNDLYKELFSKNSKMTGTIRGKYKKLVIDQFKKYLIIIKELFNTDILDILDIFKNKQFYDNSFKEENIYQNSTIIQKLNQFKYNIDKKDLNIQILLQIFLNVIIVYKLVETIYLVHIIDDKPYDKYLILDDYIKLIKNIQDLFNDKFRDYKTKTVDHSSKINVLEKMRKEVTSLLNENQRELKSIESNITEYSANNQSKINGKDSNKKDGLVEKIKTVKASITKLKDDLTKDDCDRFTKIKPIFEKLSPSNNNQEISKKLSKSEAELINILKRSFSNRFGWIEIDRSASGGLAKTTEYKKILDMYYYLKDIYNKKEAELNKKQEELTLLESNKTNLESRISKRISDKRTFTEKIANLNVLANKIDDRLMKLQSKNGSSLPNFALIQQKFTGMFKVTYDITEKYKEYTRTFAFRKSKNKVWFLYDENQKKFNKYHIDLLKNIYDLVKECNTSKSVSTSKNSTEICKSVKGLTDSLIKKMINDKSKNFLTELEKYFKDATPIENPFFEEYKFHYESMTRQILILLTKINTKKIKLKDDQKFEKIKGDYMKHIDKKKKVLEKINKVIKSHIEKIQDNNKKIANNQSYNNKKNSSNKPPFIVAPYTYVLFAYFIDLLLIIDYLTFFYQ